MGRGSSVGPAGFHATAAGENPAQIGPGFMIEFTVPGRCVPWARAGGGKTTRRFTPERQADYMQAIQVYCRLAMGNSRLKPLTGPVGLLVRAVYALPRGHRGIKWHTSRPDADNILKLVADALNGIAWLDDCQVSSAQIVKVYAIAPELQVRIHRLDSARE